MGGSSPRKNISYQEQFSINGLRGVNGGLLRFDFAIMNDGALKCLIEYQGDIHYDTNYHGWNTLEAFKIRKKYDEKKLNYCIDNNIKL